MAKERNGEQENLPGKAEAQFVILGVVTDPDHNGMGDVLVRVEEKSLRHSHPLGEATADTTGRYEISYDPSEFRLDEQGGPDLCFRVLSPSGRALQAHVTDRDLATVRGEQILFNASPNEEVNLVVASQYGVSLYDDVVAAILPLPGDVSLRDLSAEDLRFLCHDAGRPLEHVAFAVYDARLSRDTGLPRAVFFGWAMQQIGVSPPGDNQAGVPQIDLTQVLHCSVDGLLSALWEAIEQEFIPAHVWEESEGIRERLTELQGETATVSTAEGLRTLHRLSETELGRMAEEEPAVAALVRDRAVAWVREQVDELVASSPPRVREEVDSVDLHALDPDEDLHSAFVNALTSAEGVAAATRSQLRTRFAELPPSLSEVMGPQTGLGQNPLVADDVERGRRLSVADMAGLDENRALAVLLADDAPADFSDSSLARLVNDGKLEEDEAHAVGFTSALSGLVNENEALTRALGTARFERLPQGQVTSTRELAQLSADELESVVAQADIELPEGTSPRQVAQRLQARFEYLHPDEAFFSRLDPQVPDELTADLLGRVDEFFTSGAAPFHPAAAAPEGMDPNEGESLERLRSLANAFAGMGLQEVLRDPDRSPQSKVEALHQRLGAFEQFLAANRDTDLLALDLTPGSDKPATLHWESVDEADHERVLSTLTSFQRSYALTRSAPLAQALLTSGYDSAVRIAGASFDRFRSDTGLDGEPAHGVFRQAQRIAGSATPLAGSVLDLVNGGFVDLAVGNAAPSVDEFLRELGGYQELFGSLDYCDCQHCQSILSPAAYFVDLMAFIEDHVLDPYFAGGERDHPLNLNVRRPDLWTLELTCRNTNTLIPTLTIVNEVLENYIASRRGFADSLAVGPDIDRSPVEAFVYRDHLATTTSSFAQPFLLPLREVETYLGHFDRTRAEVTAALATADPVSQPVRTRARLSLSQRGYELIVTPNADAGFLENVYNLSFDVSGDSVQPFDAQQLPQPMGVSRAELGQLVATRYVSPPGEGAVDIRSEKRDASSVQNDIERIHNLSVAALDRMHRFTRLWRVVPWSIGELDVAVEAIADAGLGADLDGNMLRHIGLLVERQQRLEVSTEELLALWTTIPRRPVAEDADALFDRLFNGQLAEGRDPYPQPAGGFVHPVWRTAGDSEHLHRLRAGLRVSDEELYRLISHLADPLGADRASNDPAAKEVALSETNLALLYRHARLAEHLGLDLADLFHLLSFVEDTDHVASFEALRAVLDGYDRWQASPYSLDDLGRITGGTIRDGGAQPDADELAATIVRAVADDDALTFADTLFASLEGVSDADSRAIFRANPTVATAADGSDRLRLADDFDPTTTLAIPVGVDVDEADVRALLSDYHASQVLPSYLATRFGVAVAKLRALLEFVGADLASPALAGALRGERIDPLSKLVAAVSPAAALFAPSTLTASDVAFATANPALFAITDVTVLQPETAWRVAAYHRLLSAALDTADADDSTVRKALHGVLTAHDPTGGFGAADPAALGSLLGAADGLITTLRDALDLSGVAVRALERLRDAVDLAQYLGVGGEALRQIAAEDYDNLARARDAVRGAFRAKYADEATWRDTVEPFEERLLALRRDALVDYLLHAVHPEFNQPSDLYHHFLLDVEVDGCARTSRIVHASASLQLYVHRCLMNLEQDRREAHDPDRIHVRPNDIPDHEWAWRKNYRVWEANRKVFLYPENYIEPELRDNKTPLFEELEETLLQQPIDEQTVLDAYAKYVRGFEEVANLQIAGAYHEEGSDTDVLHLFGATSDDPPQYYYRSIENLISSQSARGVVYNPWRKVDVQISARHASPVVFRGTLYLFWVEIATRSLQDFQKGGSEFRGYRHVFTFKYTARRLDGTWTAPQTLDLDNYTNDLFNQGVLSDLLLDGVPAYDTAEHDEPKDSYTLTDPGFTRLYPDVAEESSVLYLTGVGQDVHAAVDFYMNAISTRKGSDVPIGVMVRGQFERSKLTTVHVEDDQAKLYLSTPHWHFFDAYAHASFVADSRRIDSAKALVDNPLYELIEGFLYQHELSRLPKPADMTVVNGVVSDALIDVSGDVLYVQASAHAGEHVSVRRMGTTLAEDVGRTLSSAGVGGLLELDTQRDLQEAPSPLSDTSARLNDVVNAGELDFTGPYGVYYRELFFHIPFLIADHLNSQQHFAEAQKWYHYLFDPTAPVEDSEGDDADAQARRDRPWRYLEFRGLDAGKLRDFLADSDAIEEYKTDPFNPHAIARLRLSAYQKAVVMKYVDNLLDWGDALFTQDTRESINEAALLYTMASDILGDRPAEIGSCGEATPSPRTYERIGPLIREDSSFLIELEQFVITGVQRSAATVEVGDYTIDGATIADAVSATGGGAISTASAVLEPAVAATTGESPPPSEGIASPQAAGDAVYRTDWARTASANWEAAGTALAPGDGASGQPGGASVSDRPSRTHVRPDLVDDLRLPSFGVSLTRQVNPVFCVPPNNQLDAYWDRVEDRLYKIRHCMNISGVRRQLALFAPPIDPALLVRARAAGVSIEDALGLTAGALPPYRFNALIGSAKEYAQAVQTFGAALLAALEKKDAEELAQLRLVHEENLQKLQTQVREQEVETARRNLEAVTKRQATVEYRKSYFQGLLDTGLNSWEVTQSAARHASNVLKGGASILDFLAGAFHVAPEIGAPTSMKYGGKQVADSSFSWASGMRDLAGVSDSIAASAGLEAGFQRREEGWQHQVDLADHELADLEQQKEAANVRLEIAQRQLENHRRAIEHTQEVSDFYDEKFTGVNLYTWLASTLQRLYRQSYNSALAMARLAEHAFHFERPDLTDVRLSPTHWEAGHRGLLAGEQLVNELRTMERRFIETDDRHLEIDQAFSLQQVDPAALLRLKTSGECTFTIPERYFDLFYPGQYRRILKAARLTIPSVTGPYTNISATLHLLGSDIRRQPDLEEAPAPSHPSRTTTVATSTGQNDAGVFELTFRGERYLPFEGAGAVNSEWRLSLPKTFKPFDYDSINDVILRLSYTAEYDEDFRHDVERDNAGLEGSLTQVLTDDGLARALHLRHELSTTFHRLLHAELEQAIPFELTQEHFPLFVRDRPLAVKRALLVLQPAGDQNPGRIEFALDSESVSGFTDRGEVGGLPAADVTTAFAGDPRGEHSLEVRASGQLAPDDGTPPAVGSDKLEDLVLYIEYGLQART